MYESNPATVASLLQPITSLISRPGLLNPIPGASTEIYLDTAGSPLSRCTRMTGNRFVSSRKPAAFQATASR